MRRPGGRVAALCCVYDFHGWLGAVLDSIEGACDAIYLLVGDSPWRGERGDIRGTMEALASFPDPERKLRVVRGDWSGEEEQRNAGLRLIREAGFEYFLIVDSDEVHEPRALERALALARERPEVDCWGMRCEVYWKSVRYRIEPTPNYYPPVLVRVLEGLEFVHVRRLNYGNPGFLPEDLAYHHLSYVRTDEEMLRKLDNSSHRDEVRPGWFEEVWRAWDRDPQLTDLHPTHPSAFRRAVETRREELPARLQEAWDRARPARGTGQAFGPSTDRVVAVVGRGRSGTRALSQVLAGSGVFMGSRLNESGDKVPADDLYEACRVLGRKVRWRGGLDWDFAELHEGLVDPAFTRLVESYLADVLESAAPWRGWKLPETVLIFPWLVRLFPRFHYVGWVRDPRDCVQEWHVTDDLAAFGVPGPRVEDPLRARAVSWYYQRRIVLATPRPRNYLEIRFEDFVLWQDPTLRRLEEFLGLPLARLPVDLSAVGRHRHGDPRPVDDFLVPDLEALGYLL